jgi:hypothetical protein
MEEVELITAKGEGVWGNQKYQVALTTRIRTYHDSLHKFEKRVSSYRFTFRSPSISDRRIFPSEEKRRLFMAQSFTELMTEEITESAQRWEKLTSPVRAVEGHKLTAVIFVMGYLELEIPPHKFRAYNWPLLYVDGKTIRSSDAGYQETLRTFADKQVSRFDEYLDKGITLEFEHGSSLGVPVKVSADFRCPEVAEFWGPGVSGYIWQANVPPFD